MASRMEQYRRLSAFPERVFTDDGRELRIRLWQPTVAVDEEVTVKLEAFIVKYVDEYADVKPCCPNCGWYKR